ncbi:MAG: type II toxin-antitoxin system HicB family antitoxin [bacterium]
MAAKNQYTAIITKTEEGGYTGQLLEVPEVITEAWTIEELKENLSDALQLILDYRKEEALKKYKGIRTIRRKIFA